MRIEELNEQLSRERKCGPPFWEGISCPMKGKTFVGADSRTGEVGHVSVLFMGLNPGVEEARRGLPFVGPSGRFLRRAIENAPVDWAIVNSILCSSPNQTGIVNPQLSSSCCRRNVAYLWSLFTPDIIVPCGNGAASVFEIPEGITRAETMYYVSRGRNHNGRPTIVAPIQHPSALIRSGGTESSKYPGWIQRLSCIFSVAVAFPHYGSPEETLDSLNTPWKGLFGLTANA